MEIKHIKRSAKEEYFGKNRAICINIIIRKNRSFYWSFMTFFSEAIGLDIWLIGNYAGFLAKKLCWVMNLDRGSIENRWSLIYWFHYIYLWNATEGILQELKSSGTTTILSYKQGRGDSSPQELLSRDVTKYKARLHLTPLWK